MRIIALNGSPKATGSLTARLVEQLGRIGGEAIPVHAAQALLREADLRALWDADALLIAFPLYVDALPAPLVALLARIEAGSARIEAESARIEAGSARIDAESARIGAGSARIETGSARIETESARIEAGSARIGAGSARIEAESARNEAESARNEAGSARIEAGSARIEAESAQHAAMPKGPQSGPRVYALCNCGFYESAHNALALNMVRHFAQRCGLPWGYGLGIGCGPMLASMGDDWSKGPAAAVHAALSALLASMGAGTAGPDVFAAPRFPRMIYKAAAQMGWRQQAGKNGVRGQLRAKPYV